MELVYNILTSNTIIFALIGFIFFSYLIVGLLTWSFIKPLKYLGFPIIIVGLFSFALKGLLTIGLNSIELDGLGIIRALITSSGNIFVKFAVIFISTGTIMVILYFVLNKVLKSKNSQKPKEQVKAKEESYIESAEEEISEEEEMTEE